MHYIYTKGVCSLLSSDIYRGVHHIKKIFILFEFLIQPIFIVIRIRVRFRVTVHDRHLAHI